MSVLLSRYQAHIKKHGFVEDPQQIMVLGHLEKVLQAIAMRQTGLGYFQYKLHTLFKKMPTTNGIYLWGNVGRGKTFLVDLFFDALPTSRKLRLHFHRFMRRVHHELASLKDTIDPLEIITKRFAKEADVICFDEFFVSDITDAMLLGRLLQKLLGQNLIFIATSNIPPDRLYENGLQRSQFLPVIALLQSKMDVIHLDTMTDYRMQALQQAELYYYPVNTITQQKIAMLFAQLSPREPEENVVIEILDREILAVACADDVVWFDFNALCDGPRSAYDYIEIASCFHTVFLTHVPVIQDAKQDVMRRFIALVDEFYERHVKLVMQSEVALELIYQGSQLKFEFARTLSRLTQMQSQAYLQLAHKS